MLAAGGINVDRCKSREGIGTKIGVWTGSQPIGAGCNDRKLAAR
jgi:hypothetical protein